MIQVSGVGLRYGDRKLFEDVNIKFTSSLHNEVVSG